MSVSIGDAPFAPIAPLDGLSLGATYLRDHAATPIRKGVTVRGSRTGDTPSLGVIRAGKGAKRSGGNSHS